MGWVARGARERRRRVRVVPEGGRGERSRGVEGGREGERGVGGKP